MAEQTHDQAQEKKRPRGQPPERAAQDPEAARQTTVDPATAFNAVASGSPRPIKPEAVFALQQTVGNRAVGRLLANRGQQQAEAQATPAFQSQGSGHAFEQEAVAPATIVATEPIEEEEAATAGDATAHVATEPIEEEETATAADATAYVATEPIEEEETATAADATAYVATQRLIVERQRESTKVTHRDPRDVTPTRQPSPVLVPVDPAKAGACVIVKGKKFAVWINPTQPKCIVGGMQKHEEKHIADFKADTNYKDIPKSGKVPEGETFYYKSAADAKRFEHPAIDIEIAWIKKQLKGQPKPKDKRILDRRAKVTLPRYRASFK